MQFTFQPEQVAMLNECVSAFYEQDGQLKAVATMDMLPLSSDGELCFSPDRSMHVKYSLVEQWIKLENVRISFDLSVTQLGYADLLSLSRHGYVRLSKGVMQVHLIAEEGEFTADISGEWDLSSPAKVTIAITDGVMRLEVADFEAEVELPENCREGLEVSGFFGEVEEAEMRVRSITIA